jgi:hypothetical protein
MTLSIKQQSILTAVNASAHTQVLIAKRAGVGELSLWHWMTGKHEPTNALYDAVMQSIVELEQTPISSRIDWDSRIAELISMKSEGMNPHQMARQLSASQSSIRRACLRHGI